MNSISTLLLLIVAAGFVTAHGWPFNLFARKSEKVPAPAPAPAPARAPMASSAIEDGTAYANSADNIEDIQSPLLHGDAKVLRDDRYGHDEEKLSPTVSFVAKAIYFTAIFAT